MTDGEDCDGKYGSSGDDKGDSCEVADVDLEESSALGNKAGGCDCRCVNCDVGSGTGGEKTGKFGGSTGSNSHSKLSRKPYKELVSAVESNSGSESILDRPRSKSIGCGGGGTLPKRMGSSKLNVRSVCEGGYDSMCIWPVVTMLEDDA